jgi:glycosyltransferase involved in cell wall biosynthesis
MKISIVTPSFNQAKFLEQTLRSVLDQSYQDLEYVVIDGGSTDGSVEIIRRYAHHLTYWRSEKDDGQADAVSQGFERCTGEIFGWLNSDDVLLPGCLRTVAQHFESAPNEECIAGGAVFLGKDGTPLRRAFGVPFSRIGSSATFRMLLIAGCPFCQPATFWRRGAFVAAGGLDTALQFSFDYDLYLRFALRRRIGHIRRLLAGVRLHEKSKTRTLAEIHIAEDALLRARYGLSRYSKTSRAVLGTVYRVRNSLTERAGWARHVFGLLEPPIKDMLRPEPLP